MKGKMVAMFGVLALFVLLLANSGLAAITNATVTLDAPAAGGQVTGSTYVLNSTLLNSTAQAGGRPTIDNATNVSWFYTVAGGSAVYIGKNSTAVYWNETVVASAQSKVVFDSKVLYDQSGYTITTCMWNFAPTQTLLAATTTSGENVSCDTSLSVTADNHNPTCRFTTPSENNLEFDDELVAVWEATNSTTCTLTVANKLFNGTYKTGTDGSEVCTKTVKVPEDFPEGRYTVSASNSDYSATADSTGCAVTGINFKRSLPASRGAAITEYLDEELQPTGEGGGQSNAGKVAAIAIIGYAGYVLLFKKKGLGLFKKRG